MKRRTESEDLLLTIQALAQLCGASVRDLRRYEVEGLIVSSSVVTRGRRVERLYTRATVVRVRRIRSFEELGVNLAGIDVILRLLEQSRARRRRSLSAP